MDIRIETAAKKLLDQAVEFYQEEHKQGRDPIVSPMVAFCRLNEEDTIPSIAIMPGDLAEKFFNQKNPIGKQQLMFIIEKCLAGDIPRNVPWGDGKSGDVRAIFVIIEAFMKMETDPADIEKYRPGSLAADPTSSECVMLQIHTLEGTRIVMQPVKEGFLIGERKEFGAGLKDGGDMTGALAMPTPTKH
jgi:hypothetical protein